VAGITPIDAPFFDLRDQARLKQEVAAAMAFGFAAKAAIHPTQIEAIEAALAPSAEAVAVAVAKARGIED
jgi:(S)-citramalyl-CoA lyase